MSRRLHLVAHVAGRGVAVPADEVASVVELGVIVPVPAASDAVLGIAALRSRVVTVIDTWAVLGVPRAAREPRALVTRVDGHDYAVPFDAVEDVATVDIAPLPAGTALDGAWRRAARGLAERDGEPLLVVSLAEMLPRGVSG